MQITSRAAHIMRQMLVKIGIFFLITFNAYSADISRGETRFKDYCAGCHTLKYELHQQVSMPPEEGENWFGRVPPDLSLITTVRGVGWVQQYLQSFYPDEHARFGVNNRIFPQTKMPNVLASLTPTQANQVAQDIAAYLAFVAEPVQNKRYQIGYFVLGFLSVFIFIFLKLVKKNKR